MRLAVSFWKVLETLFSMRLRDPFHDDICVLVAAVKNHKTIYGGGNAEIRISIAVDEYAKTV